MAASTKKTDLNTGKTAAVDVTKQKQAITQADVDAQDSRTRLWQSLSPTYDEAIEESEKRYALSKGEADRAAIARGMGRSSYNLATLANIDAESAAQSAKLGAQKIAAYQQGLNELEQQEKEDEKFWEQFKYQQGRDKIADDQWKQQFAQSTKSSEQQVAMSFVSQILAAGGTPTDALLQQAGLSRADYEAMKQKASSGGYTPKSTNPPPGTEDGQDADGDNIFGTWFEQAGSKVRQTQKKQQQSAAKTVTSWIKSLTSKND